MKTILLLTLSAFVAYFLMLMLPVVLICWLIQGETTRMKVVRCDAGRESTSIPSEHLSWIEKIEAILRDYDSPT
jgi:hypothetical protein